MLFICYLKSNKIKKDFQKTEFFIIYILLFFKDINFKTTISQSFIWDKPQFSFCDDMYANKIKEVAIEL